MSDAEAPAVERSLLATLRAHLDCPTLAFAEPPVRLFGGNNTVVHAFRLERAPPPWERPLVVRVLKAHRAADEVDYESAIQNTLADLGVPAPRVLLAERGREALGGPFQVMERVEGRALLLGDVGAGAGGLRMVGALLRDLRAAALGPWPEQLARVHAELHRRPAAPLAAALDSLGMRERATVAHRIERLAGWIRPLDQPGLEAALEGLRERAPDVDAPGVVCHGDLFPNQVFQRDGVVTGVIDWADLVIAPPEFDVGLVAAGLAAVPVGLPGLGAVQRRLVARFVAESRRLAPLDPERLRFARTFRGLAVLCALARHRAGTGPPPVPYDSARGQALVSASLEACGVRVALR